MRPRIISSDYGLGMKGRYRIMAEPEAAMFFIERGWRPLYTRAEREVEIERRMREDEFTRDEAEWDVDEDIHRDLEEWVMLAFSKTPPLAS